MSPFQVFRSNEWRARPYHVVLMATGRDLCSEKTGQTRWFASKEAAEKAGKLACGLPV